MTEWTSENTIETAWGEDESLFQVIEFIDNEFNINYPAVNINGQQIRYWTETTAVETAWKD